MPALTIDYTLADGGFTVTTADNVVHDLTTVLAPTGGAAPVQLLYTAETPPQPILRVGLITAQFVIHLPGGQALTLDPRTGTALGRLGWTVPRL